MPTSSTSRDASASTGPVSCVTRVALMHEPMDAENGLLTQTLKPRRHVIVDHFAEAIEEAYA